MDIRKIKGVNLGGWLVLEKWMTPYLYSGLKAEDEYHVLKELKGNAEAMIRVHRDTYIKEEDFKWLNSVGINSLRLPVGYWLFNGETPYYSAEKYVDWTFQMAEKYDLEVLLDIHAAPGCQNGFDNGGLSGIMEWHKNKENIDKTIEFAKELSLKYKDRKKLLGIQLLNEPHWDIQLEVLQDYYLKAYEAVRGILDEDKLIVIHDGFRLDQWKDFMRGPEYKNVILDTHFYQCFTEEDINLSPSEHICKALIIRVKQIEEAQKYFPLIIGEWSLGLSPESLKGATGMELEAIYKAYGNAQLIAFEKSFGWYFWNYKLNNEAFNPTWCFKDAVIKGYLPLKYN